MSYPCGQVVPTNGTVQVEVDVTGINEDRATGAVTLHARGSQWVDGIKIYIADHFAVRIVDDG